MKRCFALLLALCLLLSISSPALADNVLQLPSSLKSIDEDAFRGDTSLDEVILPDGIESLGAGAFAESSLTKIKLPDSLTEIADDALPSPGLVTVTANEGTDAYNWALEKGYIAPEGSVVINETNFPDENFRGYVAKYCDTNGNGALSTEELAVVEEINCSGMDIADLTGIKNFTALKTLNCGGGWMGDSCKLTALDVSDMTALEELVCDNGGGMGAVAVLKTLNVDGCTALKRLSCNGNSLKTLDLSTNAALVLSHNPNLTKLACDGNALTELDVSHNDKLTELTMSQMALGYLDLSGNPELAHVEGGPAVMNIAGCPILLAAYEAGVNEDYDRPDWMSDNVNVYGDEVMLIDNATIILTGPVEPVEINAAIFPDETFRVYVSQFDTDEDTELSEEELAAVTEIDVEEMGIADLTGVESFPALVKLNFTDNQVSTIDLSHNTHLKTIWCGFNNLTALDVSMLPELEWLACPANQLKALDVSHNPKLYRFLCWGNELTKLDLSKNPAIKFLQCQDNQIDKLDVSGCPELVHLNCSELPITAINVTQNPLLEYLAVGDTQIDTLDLSLNPNLTNLYCYNTGLTALDVSENHALIVLSCGDTPLGELDVSENEELTYLFCSNNGLSSLDLSRNNKLVALDCHDNSLALLDISNCPTLVEAYQEGRRPASEADNATVYGEGSDEYVDLDFNLCVDNGTVILAEAIEPVTINEASFPDQTFRTYVSDNFDDGDGTLSRDEILAVAEIDVHEMRVTDLTGVEKFPALKELYCAATAQNPGQLTELDLSHNPALEVLDAEFNLLTSLNVQGCAALKELNVGGLGWDRSHLTTLNLSGYTALEVLKVGFNELSTLNVQGCTALKELYCSGNQLMALDVTGCPALSVLDCRGMNLTALDLTHNRELTSMKCDHNQITSLNLSQNGKLKVLTTEGCPITSLDLSQNGALEELDCGGNQLMALDVSHNPALTKLTCAGNQLSTLNLSQNGALRELYCGQNLLTALDVSGHKALVSLGCFQEGALALNITGCPTLVEAYENGLTLADPGPWIPEGATVYTDGTNSVLTIGPNTTVTSNAA